MKSQFADMTSLLFFFFFDIVVSFVTFSYWSKFHVNIMTGSGVTTILNYKGLARNSEIRNSCVWILPSIWKLGQEWDTKFGMNLSNKMLLNAAKCQGYSFYWFWVIKEKPTTVVGNGTNWGNSQPKLEKTYPEKKNLIFSQ